MQELSPLSLQNRTIADPRSRSDFLKDLRDRISKSEEPDGGISLTELKEVCDQLISQRDFKLKTLHMDQALCYFEELR